MITRFVRPRPPPHPRCRRDLHHVSKMFIPSGTSTPKSTDKGGGRGHELLLKAGFIRQSSAGIFSLLPLSLLSLAKLEARLDAAMSSIDASKVSLPTLSLKSLWEKTGRWGNSELYKLSDRKDAQFCLAPTHEEQITKLVSGEVNGYKQLPVRVYQLTRKFRDEMRPRGGLLRNKEFLMKDLYTFDTDAHQARKTYDEVRRVYDRFFEDLGVPYMVAEADSGSIGGDLNHEYHIPSPLGEDTLLYCDGCGYVANQELAQTSALAPASLNRHHESSSESRTSEPQKDDTVISRGEQSGRQTHVLRFAHQTYRDSIFFDFHLPPFRQINPSRLLSHAKKVDPSVTHLIPIQSSTHDPSTSKSGIKIHRVPVLQAIQVESGDSCPRCSHTPTPTPTTPTSTPTLVDDDSIDHATQDVSNTSTPPPSHSKQLKQTQSIELGHTFHLSTRYSSPLSFTYSSAHNTTHHVDMGCYGIGVTRLLATMAEILSDTVGLRWPTGLEPWSVSVVCDEGRVEVAGLVGRKLERWMKVRKGLDEMRDETDETCGEGEKGEGEGEGWRKWMLAGTEVAIDERMGKSVGYKVAESQLLGIPDVLVIGQKFAASNPDIRDARDVKDKFLEIVVETVVGRGDRARDWQLITIGAWLEKRRERVMKG